MRLVCRILEGRRGAVVRIPQQRRLVGGDEQHLAGIAERRVNDTAVAARTPSWDVHREISPLADHPVREVKEQVKKRPPEKLCGNEFMEVAKAQGIGLVAKLEDLCRRLQVFGPFALPLGLRFPVDRKRAVIVHNDRTVTLDVRHHRISGQKIFGPESFIDFAQDPAMQRGVINQACQGWGSIRIHELSPGEAGGVADQCPAELAVCDGTEPPVVVPGEIEEDIGGASAGEVADPERAPVVDGMTKTDRIACQRPLER